ncbi:MAG: isoprenylcysteine carboxyl methyltransferase family protein [Gemmatimonadaceae bacterium]
MTSAAAYLGLLVCVAFERFAELRISRRNRASAIAQGGREYGAAAFRVMAAVHTIFLVACGAEVLILHRTFDSRVGVPALALAFGAQTLRWWAIAALGPRWNVRVIVVPGLAPVTTGPYRWLRHPNYLAVIVEIAALPLVHGAWLTAVVFSALNAGLLAARIRTEEAAMGDAYAVTFADTPRLVPHLRSGA